MIGHTDLETMLFVCIATVVLYCLTGLIVITLAEIKRRFYDDR